MNGQLPGNMATLANLGKVQILRGGRNKQQGQQRPGEGKIRANRYQSYHVSYN